MNQLGMDHNHFAANGADTFQMDIQFGCGYQQGKNDQGCKHDQLDEEHSLLQDSRILHHTQRLDLKGHKSSSNSQRCKDHTQ